MNTFYKVTRYCTIIMVTLLWFPKGEHLRYASYIIQQFETSYKTILCISLGKDTNSGLLDMLNYAQNYLHSTLSRRNITWYDISVKKHFCVR